MITTQRNPPTSPISRSHPSALTKPILAADKPYFATHKPRTPKPWLFQLQLYSHDTFDKLALPEAKSNPSLLRLDPSSNALSAASPEMIVIYLTSQDILDYHLLSDFFLTFRQFMTPHALLELLIGRLAWACNAQSLPMDRQTETGRDVSVRTFVMLRHWVLNFFPDDFVPSYELRVCFSKYINSLYAWDLAQQQPSFLHILNQLRKCWLRSCALYWDVGSYDIPSSSPSSVFPGGILGASPVASMPSTRRATLLSFYNSPIKPVLSISELNSPNDSIAVENNILSMMGSLIKGGISLSTDVEVKSIKPPTPVKNLTDSISTMKDGILLPSKKSSKSLYSMLDNWKREFGSHKDKGISKFFAKIVNVSEHRKTGSANIKQGKRVSRESEHGRVRIDILSARVIEELDGILKHRDIVNALALAPTSKCRDSSFDSPSTPISNHLRTSYLDSMDMRAKVFTPPRHTKNPQNHESLLSPEGDNESFESLWDSESDISATNPPNAPVLTTFSFQSLRSFDSYDSQFSCSSSDQNVIISTPTRRGSFQSGFSTDLPSVAVPVTSSSPLKMPASRALHIWQAHHDRTTSSSSSSSGLDLFFNSHPRSGIDSALVSELANIPDDAPDINAVAAALRKLEGKYSIISSEVEHLSIAASPIRPITPDQVTPTKITNFNPSLPSFRNSHNSKLYDDAFETPTRRRSKNTDLPDPVLCKQAVPDTGVTNGLLTPESINTECLHNKSCQGLLSVDSSVKHGNHTPFILNFTSEILATQFTLIERDALAEIDWKELIEMQWKQKLDPVQSWLVYLVEKNATGVEVVISRFNLMVNWIKSEILLTRCLNERVQTVMRFIHIAFHSRRIQNYSTMMQIVLALSSGVIQQLKQTWKGVSAADMAILHSLEEIVVPFRNFQRLRAELNSLDTSLGCIPFLGLYLSDLTYNAERPAFVSAKSGPMDNKCISAGESEKLVNFDRFRTSASVVKSLMQCIEWSGNYDFQPDHDLLAKCLYIHSLTNDEMSSCFQYLDGE